MKGRQLEADDTAPDSRREQDEEAEALRVTTHKLGGQNTIKDTFKLLEEFLFGGPSWAWLYFTRLYW